jgi:hypothetical protein
LFIVEVFSFLREVDSWILSVSIVNGIALMISFSANLLLVWRKATSTY